jgi:putative transcriptional regulator
MFSAMAARGKSGYLDGQLLIAMPTMGDPRFQKTVIYVCAHSARGAMGLVVNKAIDQISFPDLLQQLKIDADSPSEHIRVHFGGPVETGRGFVLHTADYRQEATLVVGEDVALTATVDILKAIAGGKGPRRSLLALGYAGWGPGQLDQEIQANGWLTAEADVELVFDANLDVKWPKAVAKLGIDLSHLSSEAGHA